MELLLPIANGSKYLLKYIRVFEYIMSNSKSESTNTMRRQLLAGAGLAGVGLMARAASAQPTSSSPAQENEFAGRTAFITGGARGIGLGAAEALAAEGVNIVIFDIAQQIPEVPYPLASAEDLEEAQRKIESYGVRCLAIPGDVRSGKALKKAMNHAQTIFGSIDFLVVNAGITQIGPLESFSEAEISLVLDINLAGAIKTIGAATPILREQNFGRIITLSSTTGRSGVPLFPIYSATKWAMIGLTKSTALALGAHNVTCNALCPDLVRTKLLDNDYILGNIFPDVENPTFEAFEQGVAATRVIPVGALAPSDMGDTVRFLCSNRARYISGEVFDITAGSAANIPA